MRKDRKATERDDPLGDPLGEDLTKRVEETYGPDHPLYDGPVKATASDGREGPQSDDPLAGYDPTANMGVDDDPLTDPLADPLAEDAPKIFDDVYDPTSPLFGGKPKTPADPFGETADHDSDPLGDGADAEEIVGYKRPPKKHWFPKGRSAYPQGRKKGSKNESTILKQLLLDTKVQIRDRGRTRSVSVLEGMLLRFAEDSLKGNTKSAAFLLNRFGQKVSGETEQPALDEDDLEVLNSYIRKRTLKDGGGNNDE